MTQLGRRAWLSSLENIMSNALEQANIQMASIADMAAALNCDYDRLGFLREYFDELDDEESADSNR